MVGDIASHGASRPYRPGTRGDYELVVVEGLLHVVEHRKRNDAVGARVEAATGLKMGYDELADVLEQGVMSR